MVTAAVGYSQNKKNYGSIYLIGDTSADQGIAHDFGLSVAAKYTVTDPTYTNGEWGNLRISADGKLMVDTELTLDGNVMIDNLAMWATNISDSTTASYGLVDASGHPQVDVLTLPGGLTGYEEDTAHTTGDKGMFVLAVRRNTAASTSTTDGDYSGLITNSTGHLWTQEKNSADALTALQSINATVFAEDTAHMTGDKGIQILSIRQDTPAATAGTSGDYQSIITDGTGKMWVSGNYPEDGAHVSGNYGNFILTKRTDIAASSADTTEDYASLNTDATGNLWITGTDLEDTALGSNHKLLVAGYKARSSQQTAMTAQGDAVIPVATLYGETIIAGYDYSTNSNSTTESNPLNTIHVEETLAAVTNGTDGTYYYYVDMDGYNNETVQCILSGGSGTVTVTYEGTVQDDGTAPASCTYQDLSTTLTGSASFTATHMMVDDSGVCGGLKYLRVKVVANTTGANDADWTIYSKKRY